MRLVLSHITYKKESVMRKVLLGVILILLAGPINIGGHIIELTPNFIGSLLLLLSLRELKIKDKNLIGSLWILTGVYLFNYLFPIVEPYAIPLELQPLLVGGSLLWGIFMAVKIVEKARIDHGEDCNLTLNRIRKWCWYDGLSLNKRSHKPNMCVGIYRWDLGGNNTKIYSHLLVLQRI